MAHLVTDTCFLCGTHSVIGASHVCPELEFERRISAYSDNLATRRRIGTVKRYHRLFTHAVTWFVAALALIAYALESPAPVLTFSAGVACLFVSAGFGFWAASIARRISSLVRL